MSDTFNNIADINKIWFKNNIKVKLADVYCQKWSNSVFYNSVCTNYRAMTKVKKLQNYIIQLPKQYIYPFLKFKCANHYMPIVSGRYSNTPIDERLCKLCQLNEIGDEFHYLFKCNFFSDDRVKYISKYYFISPNTVKMTQLFEGTDSKEMLKLAKFISIIMKHFRSRQ